jgi:hypothetical protein
MGVDKDTGEIKLGDGVTPWSQLPTILSSQYVPLVGGKAPDADKLDGNDSSFYMPASAAAGFLPASAAGNFLPINGKAADSDLLDGHDSSYFMAASAAPGGTALNDPTRKLVGFWGSGTVFPVPANGLLAGDTYFRTDIGTNGSLWHYNGGTAGFNGWVHKGPIVCTSATRPSVVYAGLEIFETDTARSNYYEATSGRWRNAALSTDRRLNGTNDILGGVEFQMGMEKMAGSGTAVMSKVVTFPQYFQYQSVVIAFANAYGYMAASGAWNPLGTANWEGWTAIAGEVSQGQMTVRMRRNDGAPFTASSDYYFNWLAIGRKGPLILG